MPCQLSYDCLNEILEYLEEDKSTLHSCLLVNHIWCEISVRNLWRNIWDFKVNQKHIFEIEFSVLSTLIACLPNESKKHLHNNNIFISTPTSKPLLFNYASFFKKLSIYGINRIIYRVFENLPPNISLCSKDVNSLVANEIIKMFANQISSLKKLTYHHYYQDYKISNISFPQFPGARDLSELRCNSNHSSDFFYQLSQICHNLQSIYLEFHENVSNELKELISLQNNLKNLTLSVFDGGWEDIIPAITKHSHTITKLNLYGVNRDSLFSFISLFSNLQELIISFFDAIGFVDFGKLPDFNFSKLQILKIPYYEGPKPEYLTKFLENNGKSLKKVYIGVSNKALGLSISKFCPNLQSLFIIFKNDQLNVLKTILISCQYLKSIKVFCGEGYFEDYLSEKEVFETVAKYSPKNFCELKIYNRLHSDISPDDLESFFISWKSRTPKKLLSFIIIENVKHDYCNGYKGLKTLEIIKNYEDLGIIEFVTKSNEDEELEEESCYHYN